MCQKNLNQISILCSIIAEPVALHFEKKKKRERNKSVTFTAKQRQLSIKIRYHKQYGVKILGFTN